MAAIALIKTSQGIYAMTNSGTEVTGFESVTKGVRYFEDIYVSKHRQGYEGSTSACISFMQFEPRILDIGEGTMENLLKILGDGPHRAFIMSSLAGRMTGIRLPEDRCHYWDTATTVRLIP